MEPQKSAASRVRHILQAMERSIDVARERRTHTPASSNAAAPRLDDRSQSFRSSGDSADSRLIGASGNAPPRSTLSHTSYPMGQPARPHTPGSTLIGGTPNQVRNPHEQADEQKPARLKAKPKRFEGTFAAQFTQNPQPEYRAQTG